MKANINRRAYRNAPQAELAVFAKSVLQRIQENPSFEFLVEFVPDLDTALSQYQKALTAALNRGLTEVSAKNDAREKLIEILDVIAGALEDRDDLGSTRVLDAGFRVIERVVRSVEPPPVPEMVKALPTGKRGELKVQLKVWESVNRQRLLHLCEYSEDQGQTWKNGLYKPSQRFVISGLPPLTAVQLRFRAIAPNGQTSDWSDAVSVAVN
ncbi:MAG: hypothetical protein SFV22_10060 [Saprospiraceae bacterium]|nr:hypothetical protein [Saprospiraceae bacterium]